MSDLRTAIEALADEWERNRDSIADENWMPGVADQKRSQYDRSIADLRAILAAPAPDTDALAERGITVPRPQIYTGPARMSVDDATVMYLRDAAIRVRDQRYWGSGVTALVSDLLDNAADAIAATPTRPAEPTQSDAGEVGA